MTILDHTVTLKTIDNDNNLPAWEWLQHLILTLDEHGMSSEESDMENEVESVLRVKNMTWRRCVSTELDIVDFQQALDTDIFTPLGSKPVKRICASANLPSCRDALEGLSLALYDSVWLDGLTQRQTDCLAISHGDFPWMKFAVA
ncbi:hypothetical protein J3R82DRAFT_4627 [Butyriboletus roseoflavus]|nr:hypothetical protein J3R82DRAFT_4627 [Butyriboletus roseoflavus]